MSFRYIKEKKGFVLYDEEEAISQPIESIWFLVSIDGEYVTLLSHGRHEYIETRMKEMTRKYKRAGHKEIANDLMMIDVTEISIDVVNKCLSSSGYVKKIVDHLNDSEEEE